MSDQQQPAAEPNSHKDPQSSTAESSVPRWRRAVTVALTLVVVPIASVIAYYGCYWAAVLVGGAGYRAMHAGATLGGVAAVLVAVTMIGVVARRLWGDVMRDLFLSPTTPSATGQPGHVGWSRTNKRIVLAVVAIVLVPVTAYIAFFSYCFTLMGTWELLSWHSDQLPWIVASVTPILVVVGVTWLFFRLAKKWMGRQ